MRQCFKFKSFLIAVCLPLLLSCKDLLDKSDPRKLLLKNNSNENMVFYLSNVFESSTIDLLDSDKRDEMKAVNVNQSIKYSSRVKWETVIDRYAQKEILVFVLNTDSVVKYANFEPPYPPDMSGVPKTWHLNMDSLEKFNWTLTYP